MTALAVRATAPTGAAETLIQRAARRPRAGRYAMPELPIWQQMQRIGGSLTPLQVSSIIRDADGGRMASLMDLANEARQKDCHLHSVLATNEECIAGLPWEIVAPDKPKNYEARATDFVRAVLSEQRLSLRRFFAHHAGAIFYGHAVTEIEWAREGSKLVPAALCHRAARRFSYAAETGRFVWWDAASGMSYPGIDLRAEFPDQFVISQPRVTGDVQCREGLVRPLMWAALFRNWDLADWLKLAEIAWKPWRTGTYKKNASDEDIDNLQTALEGMTSSGIALVPESTGLKVEWPTNSANGSQGTHALLFSVIASEMSKAVLGQTETTESSKSSGYAQAKIHNEVRKDLRESRAKSLAEDVMRDLVEPLVRLNFGTSMRLPIFRFITEDARDLVSFSQGIKTLVDAGAGHRIPADWVNDQAGIPVPDPKEPTLAPPKPEEPPAPGKPPAPPPPEPNDGSEEDDEKEAAAA